MTKTDFRLTRRESELRNALQDTYFDLIKLKRAIESLDEMANMNKLDEEGQVDSVFGSETDLPKDMPQVWLN